LGLLKKIDKFINLLYFYIKVFLWKLTRNMEKKDADREWVLQEYKAAIAKNKRNYLNGDVSSSAEYTYYNQIEDAFRITNM